jgi:prepilin-type N-terminal cleavage/methylation domain-containing protein
MSGAPPRPPASPRSARGARGFTLVETLIALVLLLFALALAAQLLAESAQRFATAQGEVTEPPVALLVARLRGDVRAAAAFSVLPDGGLRLDGHPAGTVVYRQVGSELRRQVYEASGELAADAPAWRNVVEFSSAAVGDRLAALSVRYRRRALGRSPLPGLPANRGAVWEEKTETLLVAPRGAGLGNGW